MVRGMELKFKDPQKKSPMMTFTLMTMPPFTTVHTFCMSRDHLRNLGFLKDPAYYKHKDISAWFMAMWEKQIFARAIGI